MTPLINFSDPLSVLIALVLFLLTLFLTLETKRSIFPTIMLGAFIAIIVGHVIEFAFLDIFQDKKMIANSITVDFVFILLSYISYLWADEIESKYMKKKSIDDSLKWFWKKV